MADEQDEPSIADRAEAFLVGHDEGGDMGRELTELITSWGQRVTAMAEAGGDPIPALRAIAQTLRTAADAIDAGLPPL